MRDDLDEPAPVVVRAHRVRRRGLIAGLGTATVAVAVAVVLALQGGTSGAPSTVSYASESASPTVLPSGTASPSAAATPAPTASRTTGPSPEPSAVGEVPTPSAAPSPTALCQSTKYEECRDGKPGYGEGDSLFTCRNRTSVPSGDTTAELSLGARLELVLPASVRAEGESTRNGPTAEMVVRNDGTDRLRVTLYPDQGWEDNPEVPPAWQGLTKGAASEGALGPLADPPPAVTRDLEPNATATFTVYLETFECGDTQDDLGPALRPGDYALGFAVGARVEPLLDAGPSPTAAPGTAKSAALGGVLHLT